MFKGDEKFDLKIRSVLEEGREDVPDYIWGRIESRLSEPASSASRPGKKRQSVIFLRYAGGIAAAAAVAAAVIFRGLPSHDENTENVLAVVEQPADSGSGTGIPGDTGDMGGILAGQAEASGQGVSGAAGAVPDAVTYAEEQLYSPAVPEDSPAEEPAADTAPEKESGPQQAGGQSVKADHKGQDIHESVTEDSAGTTAWDGDFDDPGEKRGRRKIGTELAVFGNAVSNASTDSRDGNLMMSSPGNTQTTGIRELGEGNSRYGIPVSAGVGIRLSFTEKWSMSAGINYTYLSRTFDGLYSDPEKFREPVLYENIRNTQHYIGIPVDFYYSIVQKDFIDFYVYAGGTAEYCVSNSYSADNSYYGRLHYSGQAGAVQLSANAGIGVEFSISDFFGIYIDPSLRYYFRNSNAPKSIRTVQPLMLGFEAGLRFRL